MLNKVAILILAGLFCTFLSGPSMVQAQMPAGQTSPLTTAQAGASSVFDLFNLGLPNLAPKKKAATYRLCAKRQGICKCQKSSDEPGVLTVMKPSRCSPPPPPPIVQAPPLEDKSSVKEIQRLLTKAGYKPGPADGSIGPKTKRAIEAFQSNSGLRADGIPTAPLLASLRTTTAKTRVKANTATPTVSRQAVQKATIDKAPANTSKNPLSGLFGSLASTSTRAQLPNSVKGYRNCAVRNNKCICQKITDDPGVWTTMQRDVCVKQAPSGNNAPRQAAASPSKNTNSVAEIKALKKMADKTGMEPKGAATPTDAQSEAAASFFDSVAKVLTPEQK